MARHTLALAAVAALALTLAARGARAVCGGDELGKCTDALGFCLASAAGNDTLTCGCYHTMLQCMDDAHCSDAQKDGIVAACTRVPNCSDCGEVFTGTRFYVSVNGSDSNQPFRHECENERQPCKTAERVLKRMEPEDMVLFAPGDYSVSALRRNLRIVRLRSTDGPARTTLSGCITLDASHVGRGDDEKFSLLSGFTISPRSSCGSSSSGGALTVSDGAARIENCIFAGARTSNNGGALWIKRTGTIVDVKKCVFSGNSGARGGAAYIEDAGHVRFTDVRFAKNTASATGGALHIIDSANVSLTNCTLSGNEAAKRGGGIFLSNRARVTLGDKVFVSNNHAKLDGGGVLIDGKRDLLTVGDGALIFANSPNDIALD